MSPNNLLSHSLSTTTLHVTLLVLLRCWLFKNGHTAISTQTQTSPTTGVNKSDTVLQKDTISTSLKQMKTKQLPQKLKCQFTSNMGVIMSTTNKTTTKKFVKKKKKKGETLNSNRRNSRHSKGSRNGQKIHGLHLTTWGCKVLVIFHHKPRPFTGQYLQENISAEEEREEQFVFLKERATNIAVKIVGKMIWKVAQSPLQDLGFVAAKGPTHEGDNDKVTDSIFGGEKSVPALPLPEQ